MEISQMSPDMIPQLSTAMSTAKIQNSVGTSMLKKTMDVTEAGAQSLINMMRSSMEHSVYPSIGGNIDVSV